MTQVLAEYFMRGDGDEFWIDIFVNRTPFDTIGPFNTRGECERAYEDLMTMTRQLGAIDLPDKPQ